MASPASLQIIGDWRKEIGVPLRDALAVSIDVIGKSGEEACRQAVIFMAQAAASPSNNITPRAKRNREIKVDVKLHGAKYVDIYKKGQSDPVRFYQFQAKRISDDAWTNARKIGNAGLARRSWMWGLKKLDSSKVTSRPISGIARTFAIRGKQACGYILQNSLSYLVKILPAGWEAIVERSAGNRIMAMARNKLERQWQSEMRRSRRGGMAIGGGIGKYFLRAA